MASDGPMQVLKRSPARSVRLEPGGDDGRPDRIVKRFASPGLLGTARDRARARREHELLTRLCELGLPVPRPLALERRGDGWEVAMECIQDATSLGELLEGRAPWPQPAGDLARSLGRLLARLHAAGVDHPDLHPGNVLVDARGGLWAIDFHKARLTERLPAARLEAHLAQLAAGTRERTARRFRARFLLAWWRALPPERRPRRTGLAQLAQRVELRGRRERLSTVERRRLRWTRAGTAVRAVQLAGGDGYERADREAGLGRALEAALERAGGREARELVPFGGDGAPRVLVLRGAWRGVAAAWYAAARLEEHALAAAQPLAIAHGSVSWAAFALPPRGHAPASWRELRGRRRLVSLGELVGRLHDRGVGPVRLAPEELWVDEKGLLQLACVSGLKRSGDRGPVQSLRPWCAVLEAGPRERAALCTGFLRALDLPRGERAAVRAALLRG